MKAKRERERGPNTKRVCRYLIMGMSFFLNEFLQNSLYLFVDSLSCLNENEVFNDDDELFVAIHEQILQPIEIQPIEMWLSRVKYPVRVAF